MQRYGFYLKRPKKELKKWQKGTKNVALFPKYHKSSLQKVNTCKKNTTFPRTRLFITKKIQLAPVYEMTDIGCWDASQEDDAIIITFPRDPAGIKGVLVDEDKDVRIYDLMGRRLEKPRKGINIIGGKKVVVK